MSGTPSSDITRGLFATPPWIDFDHQPVGTTSAPQMLVLTNPERIALILESVAITGKNAADFSMTTDCVVGQPVLGQRQLLHDDCLHARRQRAARGGDHVPRAPADAKVLAS